MMLNLIVFCLLRLSVGQLEKLDDSCGEINGCVSGESVGEAESDGKTTGIFAKGKMPNPGTRE